MGHGRAAEIEMMHGADHAAHGIKNDVQVDHPQRRRFANDAEQDEHVGDHHRGKKLQEVLHPEMNHPEAPEIIHDESRSRTGQKPYRVKSRYGERGVEYHPRHIAEMLLAKRAAQTTKQNEHPDKKADDEEYLPQSPQVQVFPSLVAEPEPKPLA